MTPPQASNREMAEDEIFRAASALFESGSVVELRMLGNRNGRGVTIAGYFDDFRKLARTAAGYSGQHGIEGLYWTLNPCNPALRARCSNRVTSLKNTASDRDILRRARFLIDCDPLRPNGISSTDEEKEHARAIADRVKEYLNARDWPKPFMADSGNGYHLIYVIDLPNDEASRDLIKDCLEVLATRFDDDMVKIDKMVFNAARVSKVYGSLAAKGESTSDRPHRIAHLLRAPAQLKIAYHELLEALAAEASKQHRATGTRSVTPEKMEEFLAAAGIQHRARLAYRDCLKWQVTCPFDESHRAPDAVVYLLASGALAFKCSHIGRE